MKLIVTEELKTLMEYYLYIYLSMCVCVLPCAEIIEILHLDDVRLNCLFGKGNESFSSEKNA